jgi:oligopeptide transport system substrate-binding protein
MRMAYALFEGLVRWDNSDFRVKSAAAMLPDVSEDGRTFTLRMREDARWSNSDLLAANDFVFSFRRALLPDSASYYSAMLFVIKGAREFFDRRTAQTVNFTPDDDAQRLWEAVARFYETVGGWGGSCQP